jgi:hypothetical protein
MQSSQNHLAFMRANGGSFIILLGCCCYSLDSFTPSLAALFTRIPVRVALFTPSVTYIEKNSNAKEA